MENKQMENKQDVIIIPFNNELEFNDIQNVLFENGYTYVTDKNKINYNNVYECLVLRITKKSISIGLYYHNSYVKYKYTLSNEYNLLDVNNIDELYKFFKKVKVINYNEPRKLVYENKILKFNQYK